MSLRTLSNHVAVAALASLMLFGTARAAAADTITLMWDPNTESQVSGYIVHVGTQPGTYTQHLNVGLTTSYGFASAVAGQQYCFAVSAYFPGPVEGAKSSEVCGFSNRLPTLVNPGARSSLRGQSTTVQLQGADPDGQPVSYSATGLPTGLTLQGSTGFISGTPTTAGAFNVTVGVSDGVLTASQSFTWTITAPDTTAPAVTITGPTSASTYTATAATLTLSGSASDAVGVTQVSWTNSRGGSGTASGTTSWSTSGIALQSGSNVLTVTAVDAAGNAGTAIVTVTYNTVDTTVPTVTITGPTSAATYASTSTTVAVSGTASDNVGVLQVTWTNNRGGSGTATGTTTWSVGAIALQGGANVLTVTARDAAGNTASDVLTVNVNAAPALTNPGAQSSAVGQATSLQLAGSDSNGDTLSYTATGLPPGLSLAASSGLIAGTPVLVGTYPVTATVSDGALTAPQSFTWTVTPNAATATGRIQLAWDANTEPTIAGYFVYVGVQTGTYLQKLDAGLTTTFAFTNAVLGQRYCFAVTAYFPGFVEGAKSAEICGNANGAPSLASIENQSSTAGQPATLQLSGSDPEASPLTYSATGLPAGLSVAASTGTISGTPTTAGTSTVTATVSDGLLTASRTFTWTVAGDVTAPVVTITGPTAAATWTSSTSSTTLSGTASDAVGVTQVSWTNDRGGSGTATGTTSWTTGTITLQSGVNTLTVTARDAAGNTATDVLTITMNVAPTLAAVANQTSGLRQPSSLQLSGSDANGDVVTYSATGLPAGLSVNASTGLISGAPTTAGTFSVTAVVSDGSLSNSRVFTWTVTPDATAPAVAISTPTSAATYATGAATITVGGTASDLVGVTQVSWVNDRGGSGTAIGTDTWSAANLALQGGRNVITISARDAAGNTSTATLTVTRNVAPVLAAVSNQTTERGKSGSVQLSGSDADGDALTYGAIGLPPGVALTVATGLLSGMPTDVGTYTVTATVLDGSQSASQTFTWVVTADATAPAVAITAPTAADTFTASAATVNVSGTASDLVGVAQVTWSNDRGGAGTATGTATWSVSGIALQSGVNVITVTARDAAGNTASDVLTVTYSTKDITLPTVRIESPTSSAYVATTATTVVLSGTASDNVGVTRVSWVNSLGGSGVATGTTNWTVSVSLKAGANVFTVTALDAAGNRGTAVVTVYRNAAPTLSAVSSRNTRVGQQVSLQLVGADANNDVLTYSAVTLPTGLSLNTSTGLITGTPTKVGSYAVTVSVSDGTLSASRSFTWTIKR